MVGDRGILVADAQPFRAADVLPWHVAEAAPFEP